MKTDAIYGALPIDLGPVDFTPDEMAFWQYCPVKLPGTAMAYPDNLRQYSPFVELVWRDLGARFLADKYIYLTCKNLWSTPQNPGNRPGWHSDGFLTQDLNYIWCDRAPTVFFCDYKRHRFTADHAASLGEMDALCRLRVSAHHTYPCGHVLRLDQTALHKSPDAFAAGMRAFVKVSVSTERYALAGNAINHTFGQIAPKYAPRSAQRNCPITREQTPNES